MRQLTKSALLASTLLCPCVAWGQSGLAPPVATAPGINAAGPLINPQNGQYAGGMVPDFAWKTATWTANILTPTLLHSSVNFCSAGKAIYLPGIETTISTITGSVSGTILTVTMAPTGGPSLLNLALADTGGNLATGTVITGPGASVGQYVVNNSQSVSSEAMYAEVNSYRGIISSCTDAQDAVLATGVQNSLSAGLESAWVGTDNTAALNAASVACSNTLISGGGSTHPFNQCLTELPPGPYLVLGGINETGFRYQGWVIEGYGARIYSTNAGYAAFDALDSRYITLRGIAINSDQYAQPTVGIQNGRINTNPADVNHFEDVDIWGYFTVSAYYNLAGEQSLYSNFHPTNYSTVTGASSAKFDGINHFALSSQFQTITLSADTPISFGSTTCIECEFYAAGTPIWISNPSGMRFINSYAVNTAANANNYCGTLYSLSNSAISETDLDLHCEPATITNTFLLSGTASPSFPSFKFRDHGIFFPTISLFALDTGVTTPRFPNLSLDVAQIYSSNTPTVFDTPSAYSGSLDHIYVPTAAMWNSTAGNFSGVSNAGGTVTYGCTSNTPLGSGLACANGLLAFTTPNPFSANSVQASGGATAPITNAASPTSCFQIPGGGGMANWPTVTLPAPTGPNPSQALIHIATEALVCQASGGGNVVTGGSGYVNGETLTLVGGTFTAAAKVVAVVTSGTLTGFSGAAVGTYTSLPAAPISLTGTAGSGATIQGIGWKGETYAIDSTGSGYLGSSINGTLVATATATQQSGSCCGSVIVPINGQLTLAGENGVFIGDSGGDNLAAHLESSGSTPTIVCTTGTCTLSATSTDSKGTVTEGTLSTGFTLTYAGTYGTAPDCGISPDNAAAITAQASSWSVTPGTSNLVVAHAAGTGAKFTYGPCFQ